MGFCFINYVAAAAAIARAEFRLKRVSRPAAPGDWPQGLGISTACIITTVPHHHYCFAPRLFVVDRPLDSVFAVVS